MLQSFPSRRCSLGSIVQRSARLCLTWCGAAQQIGDVRCGIVNRFSSRESGWSHPLVAGAALNPNPSSGDYPRGAQPGPEEGEFGISLTSSAKPGAQFGAVG